MNLRHIRSFLRGAAEIEGIILNQRAPAEVEIQRRIDRWGNDMNIMDIVDIQHSIGKMISDLCLIRNTVCTVSADGLNGLSEYLADNQLEYEKPSEPR